jgi:hypothetical protein
MWDVPYLEVEDVANAVLLLASEEARYITGAASPVDVGMSQKYPVSGAGYRPGAADPIGGGGHKVCLANAAFARSRCPSAAASAPRPSIPVPHDTAVEGAVL